MSCGIDLSFILDIVTACFQNRNRHKETSNDQRMSTIAVTEKENILNSNTKEKREDDFLY